MLRDETKAGTQLGETVGAIIGKGGFVSDELINDIVAARTSRPDCADGFLLDGYPRTVPQARVFAALLNQRGLLDPIVIHLDVSDDALVTRLTARRQCPQCHHIYNLLSQPPKRPGVCDEDGASLLVRDDDCEAVIRRRLTVYKELTDPILQWYGDSLVRTVNGDQPLDKVRSAVEAEVLQAVQAMGNCTAA